MNRHRFGMAGALVLLAACAHPEPPPPLQATATSFESLTPNGEPFGWYVEADAASVSIAVDRTPDEGPLLTLRNDGEDPAFVYSVLPSDACNRAASVEILARSDTAGTLSGVIIQPSLGRPGVGDPVPLSPDWREITYHVTAETCLGSGVGTGALVFGDADIRQIDVRRDGRRLVPQTLSPVTAHDLEILRRLARTEDLSGHHPETRLPLTARIIAMGEASHGAAALFEMKLQILQAMAAEGTLGVVALELPAAAADRVDAYSSGRSDDRSVILDALVYPAWQTEEMMAVIDWLRTHNASASAPVRFAGFDVQHPIWAARGLALTGIDMTHVVAAMNAQDIRGAISALDALEPQWARLESGPRYARLLRRGLLVDRADLGGESRGFYMAQEALELLQHSEKTLALWADNTHITKLPGAMGGVLHAELGDDYLAIGMTFAAGQYSAYGPETPYSADPAYEGTHEKILADAGLNRDLVRLSDLPPEHPLREPRGWRYIGSTPQIFDQFLPHHLEDHFDAIGFVQRSDATTYLTEHGFR